jgi:hypothetical protein
MRIFKDNSLTWVLMLLFAVTLLGQWLAGWRVANEEALHHQLAAVSLAAYAVSPEFLSTVFENWESEFLQMSAYVVLTAVLVQRGSAESKDPDAPSRDGDLAAQAKNPDAPAALRMSRLARALYARSLGIALFLLFLASFVVHWLESARAAGEEAMAHGDTPVSTIAYLTDPQLWFESFQNWQSEFLSTAVLVVLSIYLRQRESPESKGVAAPNAQTGT